MRRSAIVALISGVMPHPDSRDSLLHACLYGHSDRARSILRGSSDDRGRRDLLAKTPFGLNCLHVVVLRGDARTARVILASARGAGIEAEVVGAKLGDLDCAEMAAASGQLDLARCFFFERRQRRRRSRYRSDPQKNFCLALEGNHFQLAAEMAR